MAQPAAPGGRGSLPLEVVALTRESGQSGDEAPKLVHVPKSALTVPAGQSNGMQRLEAISGRSAGSAKLWMGESHVAAGSRSADHHHGESESAIFVVSGNPEFVFLEDGVERRIRTRPGDYVYVPPFVPHREENPSNEEEAVVVLARSTQESIVVNLPSLSGE
jgi:uncharacterized RmlC-like cupin family protein